ncbi:MAG: PRC-barrel domain-containing protein [Phycisphaerae bacterium]|nr:PRC-barrel domain-containing protein [Phycisphaerae bacterium]
MTRSIQSRLLIALVGTTSLAVAAGWAGADAQSTPRDTPGSNVRSDDRMADGAMQTKPWKSARAQRAAEYMRQHSIKLTSAIEAAANHVDGQAVDATWRTTSTGPDGPLTLDVTVIDKNGRLVTVAVDGATGKVASARPYVDGHGDSNAPFAIMKASDFKGRDVMNASNEKVADIEELAVDVARGRIAYVILDLTGGVNRHVAVPWTALSHNDETCTLNVPSGTTLNAAPKFESSTWSTTGSDSFARSIADFYRQPVYGSDEGLPADRTITIVKLSDILGTDVRDSAGKNLGEIEDLALDPNGRVRYAALSFGGFLGINDKLFAVPWHAMSMPTDGKAVLAVDKSRLKDAPGFDKKNWPSTSSPEFDAAIRDYYPHSTPGSVTNAETNR